MSSNATVLADLPAWQQFPVGLTAVGAVAFALFTLWVFPALLPAKEGDIHTLGGLSILTAWPFFSKRYDFLRANFQKTGQDLFKFHILQHSVVAVRGEAGRKAFFDDKSLDFTEGYKILMGAAPRLSDISIANEGNEDVSWFNKQLLRLLSKDRLTDVVPTLFDDVNSRMEAWGKTGRIDPFRDIYDLVFQMTVSMATCREFATDMEALAHFQKLYWVLEKSATPTNLLLPWFPSKAKRDKEAATKELFTMLYGYVEKRRAAAVPNSDAIDLLIGQGLDNQAIIGFILGVVFAGVINTGINSVWLLLFLSANPEWKKKVTDEVNSLISTHTNTTSTDPLHKRLSAIPISAWDEEMPVLESVVRETIRIVVNGATLRRNVSRDLKIAGKTVPKGAFMTYQLADIHLNPEIYTNPAEFDPDRFGPGREEDKKQAFGYMGWGGGRHPCTGMKVAKLELKIIVALFITGYEFDLVDGSGKAPNPFPRVNYNDIHQARPLGDPCYLQFKRVVE